MIQKLQKESSAKGDISLKKYDEYREKTEKKLETYVEKINSLEQNLKDKDELVRKSIFAKFISFS